MKTISLFSTYILLLLLAACVDQIQTSDEILGNTETREEIMEAISNDPELMKEMMGHMVQNDQAVQALGSHRDMMDKMMGNRQMMTKMMEKDSAMSGNMMDHMMAMMEKDSAMCTTMCNKMGGNKHMMAMMKGGMMNDSTMNMVCRMHRMKDKQ